jgi:hypothetical protein
MRINVPDTTVGVIIRINEIDENGKAVRESEFEESIFSDSITSEALSELFDLSQWLLSTLLGSKHQDVITDIFNSLKSYRHHTDAKGNAVKGKILHNMDLRHVAKLKPDLLDLVRGLRIASASLATSRQKERAAAIAKKSKTGRSRVTTLPPSTRRNHQGSHKHGASHGRSSGGGGGMSLLSSDREEKENGSSGGDSRSGSESESDDDSKRSHAITPVDKSGGLAGKRVSLFSSSFLKIFMTSNLLID